MYIHIYGKLQNFIQLSLNLTLVCHIKCNHPVNFHFSLYRFHRKGWMATKFTRPQPTWLSCVGCKCNASGISRSSVKARDHYGARLRSALQQIMGWLAADSDQQSYINDVWMHAPWAVVDILNIWYELYTEIFWLNSVCCFRRNAMNCVF